jgi:signal transduction histidine kinase
MVTHVLVLGASETAERALRDAVGQIAGKTLDVARDEDDARRRLAEPAREVDVVLVGSGENAPRVAQTSFFPDGKRPVHLIGAPTTVEAARALLESAQADARARAERQETLLSMIAHDVRAPLGVALGAIAEMAHPSVGALTDEQKKLLRLAKRSLDRLSKLSGNVSQLARIDAHRLALARAKSDLGAIARDVAERIERDEDVGQVPITVDASPAPCDVDRDKVAVAIDNLVSNAVRFARTQVVMRSWSEGGRALLAVEDDGPGLPAGTDDLFDRVRSASMRAGKTGSGLGLAVVRGIARAHGGDATCETIATDGSRHGARFVLSFPA